MCVVLCQKMHQHQQHVTKVFGKEKNSFANVTVINQKKDKTQFNNNINTCIINTIYDEYKIKDEEIKGIKIRHF